MHTDYYPVLLRAVSTLDSNTETARRAVYDRARVAIMDAGLTPSQTQEERSALEAAIERIEDEVRTGQSSPSPRQDWHAPSPDRPSDAASTPGRSLYRVVALAGAAIVVVAIIGYAVWPRSDAPGGDQKQSRAAAPNSTATETPDKSADAGLSYVYRRQLVYYRTVYPPGTIVIAKSQRNLYLVRPSVSAVRYTIGVGRGCTNAVGLLTVSDKTEAPAIQQTRASATRSAAAPGAAAVTAGRSGDLSLALGDTGLRIEGTDPPVKDGGQGCFALANEDMADLYDRVSAKARVVIN